MKVTTIALATSVALMGLTLAGCAAQKTEPAVVSGATKAVKKVQPEAISGATKKREAKSGAIRLTETDEGQKLLRDMVREFIWTGDSTFDGVKVGGGRQMFTMATSDNNEPEAITAELTPDYDEATGTFRFYGTTAKDSGKILRASRSGTGMSVAWVKQLRGNELRDYGWNYYDSYGISFSADLTVYRSSDLNGNEAHDRPILENLKDIMGKSLTTIKEWNLIWKFDPALEGKALSKAQDRAVKDFLSYEDVYELNPKAMIVISYFARPLMVNPNNAFVYRQYAINSNVKGFNLKTSEGYKAAVRDTNCENVMTTERKIYNYLDAHYPRSDKRNILNRIRAYKNKAIFGVEDPEPNAKPTAEGLKLVEAVYNKGGKMLTAAEVDAVTTKNPGKKATYHWVDTTKRENMPDRYMITYTGFDSDGTAYRVDLPNWNRWFVLHPNNVCGIATRHTISWK